MGSIGMGLSMAGISMTTIKFLTASSGPLRGMTANVACVVVLTVSGCSSEQLPSGASLSISPDARTIDIVERRAIDDPCVIDDDDHVDLPLVIALRDPQGAPIGDAVISVYVDFAANTYSGYPVLALYDDLNGNGVVDDDGERVSDSDDSIARVRTGDYSGDRALLLRVNLSCAYRGQVFAFVDGVSAMASIEVKAEGGSASVNQSGDGNQQSESRRTSS